MSDGLRSPPRKNAPRALRLALEPRVMFDAAGAATAVAATKAAVADSHDASAGSQALLDAVAKAAAATVSIPEKSPAAAPEAAKVTVSTPSIPAAAPAATTPVLTSDVHQVVIVDTSVADYQTLIAGTDPAVPIILLGEGQRTVQGIAEALSGYKNLDSIVLVTEGGNGGIILGGNHVLTDGDLAARADDLAAIGSSLKTGGDFLLLGCSIAADDTGKHFVDDFAKALGNGVDVAASTDRTGPAALGGDWVLEYSTGAIADSVLPFAVSAMEGIDHCLGCTAGTQSTSGHAYIYHNGVDIGGYSAHLYAHPIVYFWTTPGVHSWDVSDPNSHRYTSSLAAFLARTDVAQCQSGPTVTDAKISISGATGTGGAYKIGDTVIATWDNSAATGDNNASTINTVTIDFSQFGGGSAVTATNVGGKWSASYQLTAGIIDAANRNVSVTATSATGPTTTSDTTNATVDNIAPTVTDARISLSGASGTGGAFKIGDTVTATWDNSGTGDNNSDTMSTVTVDFTAFGGGNAVAASNTGNKWSASFTITAGSLDATGRNVSVTVKDNAGNSKLTADTSNATVDSVAPTVTDANISISGATGTSGTYKIGDTVTATWDNRAGADNNADTISGVTVDFSQFGGGNAVAASNIGGLWTATYVIAAAAIDTTGRNVTVTATDNAGNTTSRQDTTNASVDATLPIVSDANIGLSNASGSTNVFVVGDTVYVTWDNSATGNNSGGTNGDIVSVTADFSAFGGGSAVSATNVGGIWTAQYLLPASAALGTNKNVTITVTDDGGNVRTTADTTNATVANTAPVLDASKSPALPNQSNTTTSLPVIGAGTLVSTLVENGGGIANVSDANSGALVGLAITGSDATHGIWWYTTDGGHNWTNLNATTTSNTAALLLAADGNTRLYFQVTDTSYSDTITSGLTFRAWDRTTGTAGSKVTTATNGGTTAFSSATDTVSLTLTLPGPTISDNYISISGATGTGGAFKIGDTVTAVWDNSATGDNNSDTVNAVTMNFSAFGGGSVVSAIDAGGKWTATYLITAGSIDATNRNVSVTATSIKGTLTTTDTSNATVDAVAPTVTAGEIGLSGGTGASGAFKIGDTVTATWNNSATGDNNSDTISGVTVDFSQFGGGSAVNATNVAGIWTATYAIVSGSIDATGRNVAVTATDDAGNIKVTAGANNVDMDNVAPTVSGGQISLSGATGTGGVFRIGDTVTATWDNSATGDNNSDTISGVTVDFSQFGGGTVVNATNVGGKWTATYLVAAGVTDTTGRNVTVTAADNAGNSTATAGTNNAEIDSVAPTVSDGAIDVSGGSGTGGAFVVGDTVTVTWDNSATGDNNSDTISGVTVDFSVFGGSSAVTATNTAGVWTATYVLSAGVTLGTNRNVTVTATDNAGNDKTVSDTSNVTVANSAPVLDPAKSPALPSQTNAVTAAPSGAVGTLVSTLVVAGSGINNVSDANTGDGLGIALTGTDISHGAWWYSTNGGVSWTAVNSVSSATALLLKADGNTRLYFQVTDSGYTGTMTSALTIRAWDQSSGAADTRVSTVTSGGISAFSAATDTVSLNIRLPGPLITDGNISITGASGTGGTFRIGDTVTATWDNSASGDNNSGVSGATVDFSAFGGGSALAATNVGDLWTASYVITAGAIDATSRNVSVSATTADGTLTTTDTTNATVDSVAPTVTDGNISVSGSTGTGGSYRIGDTVTATWGDAGGDNNSDVISGVTVDFSAFGGVSAVAATNVGGVWSASYVIVAGSIDATNRNISVTATDNAGNWTTTADTANVTVDSTAPTVADSHISLSGASGTGGAYRIGDTVTAIWNNAVGGDNNSDVISGVTVDFSAFGGGSAVAATNVGGVWSASYTIVAGSIDATNRNVSVTATDNAGNLTTTADTTNATVDSVAPIVTDGNISVSGATGTGGSYRIGDTVTVIWNASADGNSDTMSGVTVDFSAFGGGSTVVATNVGGLWSASYVIVAGSVDATGRNVSVTATDNAGNLTTTADTTNATVDSVAPTVTDSNISISGATGPGGAYRIGDTVTATWSDVGGDNNSDVISGVTVDFSAYGGGSAVAATNVGGVWSASYTIVAGSIDATNRNVSVTATDNTGNQTTTADTTNASVDSVAPTVTDGNISLSGATGTGGTYRIGDTVTAIWNASADGNSDTMSGVTVDFSAFGGGSTVVATNVGGLWSARYVIVAGSVDATGRNVSVTATDNAGNLTTTADTTNTTVDSVAPTVTDGNISVSGATGTGGAYRIGDTVTAVWSNAVGGDNNSDVISGVTVDFSAFGGGAAVSATNVGGAVWSASYVIVAGSVDATGRNVSVTSTDNAGNRTTAADTTNVTVDSIAPTVTNSNISLSGATGTGGAYRVGDIVTAIWNASADGNSDTMSDVTVDFSAFGGGSAVSATNVGGVWSASYVIVAGSIDATNRNVSVIATDNAGNRTTTADTTNATVDSVVPIVTDGNISLSGATGTGGAYRIGDIVTAVWNNAVGGDNNSDIISGVTVDFSAFGGGSAVSATNVGGVWSASYTIVAGSIDATNRNVSVTATDNVGNQTTMADTTNARVDSVAPTVTDSNISVSGATGPGGAYRIGDTVTATWSDVGGDNNSDVISGVTFDFSAYGGGSAIAATNIGGVWSASYVIVAGSVDATDRNVSVTATDNTGNQTTTADTTNAKVDSIAPIVTDGNISLSGATGTAGVYRIGDTVTAIWNASADGNGSPMSGVTVDFSAFGGGAAVAATNIGDVWSASYVIVAGSIDAAGLNVSVTATDNAGNRTTSADMTSATVDSVAPTVTDGNISVSGATGTGGIYRVGDTIAAAWNASADGNSDPMSVVTVDFSAFGGASAVVATNVGGVWTASYVISAIAPLGVDKHISVTAVDGSGNGRTAVDGAGGSIVNIAPSLTTTGQTASYTEGGADVSLFNGSVIGTGENGQTIEQIGLTVRGIADGAAEILTVDGSAIALINGNRVTTGSHGYQVTVVTRGDTASVIISGSLSTAAAEVLVDALSYRNVSEDPTGSRVVSLTRIQDNGGTADGGANATVTSITATVALVAINDAPVLSIPGGQTYIGSDAHAVGGIRVTDIDVGSGVLTVVLSTGKGVLGLSVAGVAQLTGNNTGNLTVTGTLVDVNATLASLTYTAPADNTVTGTLTDSIAVAVSDNGYSGSGGIRTASGTIAVTVDTSVTDPFVAPPSPFIRTLPPVTHFVDVPPLTYSGQMVITPTILAFGDGSGIIQTTRVGAGNAGVSGTGNAGLSGNTVIFDATGPGFAHFDIRPTPDWNHTGNSPDDFVILSTTVTKIIGPSVIGGLPMTFELPGDLFQSSDAGELTIVAQQADGKPLPDWLQFDPKTGMFKGQPPANVAGYLVISVIAKDPAGNSTVVQFDLTVGRQSSDAGHVPDFDRATGIAGKPSLTAQLNAAAGFGAGSFGVASHNDMPDDSVRLLASLLGVFSDTTAAEHAQSSDLSGGIRLSQTPLHEAL